MAPAVAIWAKVPEGESRRSIPNCVSLLLLSVQFSRTEVGERSVATRLVGAAGAGSGVVTVATFEKPEAPALFDARTW